MSKELKHIGPFVERLIYDSWSINGYLVTISSGIMGGGCIKIYRGAETVKWMPTDCTYNVVLLYLNNCIWACENDCIHFLPEKPFQPKTSEAEKGLLYHQCATWPDYKAQFKIQDCRYIDTIDEKLIEENANKIAAIALKELKESVVDANAPKKKKSG
jgi:hypothetical protein